MPVLHYEKKARIAWITLNRPEKMNALDSELLDELKRVWIDFRDDDEVWVAVLTGAGRSFCAGADFQSIGEPGIQVGFNVLREDPTLYSIWKPIIAAINGPVIGRGVSLALACDIRVASEKAEFAIPEAKFGIIPGDVDLIERFLPPGIAREMLFFGSTLSAQRAYHFGLVNKVVPDDQLMTEAAAMAERLTRNSPLALRGIKEMLARARDIDYKTAVSIYEMVNSRVVNSRDYVEGVKAIAEKRRPDWQGR